METAVYEIILTRLRKGMVCAALHVGNSLRPEQALDPYLRTQLNHTISMPIIAICLPKTSGGRLVMLWYTASSEQSA